MLMHMVWEGACLAISISSDQYLKCFDTFLNFCLAKYRTPTQRSVQPTQIKLKFSQIKQ